MPDLRSAEGIWGRLNVGELCTRTLVNRTETGDMMSASGNVRRAE
jgi:hypothetical protein